MTLRRRIVLPLVLTLGLLGAAAVGAVLMVGEQQAVALARSDLEAGTLRAADDVRAAVDARTRGVALLAFAKTQTDFTTGALEVAPEDAAAAEAELAALFRQATPGRFARVVVVDAEGRERAAYERGGEAAPDPARDHRGSAAFARFQANPLRAPQAVVEDGPGGPWLAATAAVVDAHGAFAGVVRGEAPLVALAPVAVPGFPRATVALVPAGDDRAAAPPSDQDDATSEIAGDAIRAVAEAAVLPGPTGPQRWYVVAAASKAEAIGPVLQPVYLLGVALVGIAIAAAAVVAAVVARSLQPLERLSEAVGRVGAGPPTGHVAPEGPRELQVLAEAFNGMVDRLREREAALAREFESRAHTAKLATLGSLSAGVAHEIKNPLTGMKLQTHLLQDLASGVVPGDRAGQQLAQATRRMLEVNRRGIDRIEKVVSSLGMLARPRPELEAVDVAAVVEASVALAGAPLRGRAEVTVDVPRDLRAQATTDGLGQVLLNLVGNAVEAMPREDGWLRVAARREGERVRITVEDNGPGIPPEVAARLGEPFFTTKPTGTGLGLSISRRLLHEVGAELRFDNRPEGGARFTVDLAAAEADPPEPPARWTPLRRVATSRWPPASPEPGRNR